MPKKGNKQSKQFKNQRRRPTLGQMLKAKPKPRPKKSKQLGPPSAVRSRYTKHSHCSTTYRRRIEIPFDFQTVDEFRTYQPILLNPRTGALGAWVQGVSQGYQRWRANHFRLHFQPSCGTQTAGVFYAAFTSDPRIATPTSPTEFSMLPIFGECQIWDKMSIDSRRELDTNTDYYVTQGGDSQLFSEAGAFHIATRGTLLAPAVPGILVLELDITMFDPQDFNAVVHSVGDQTHFVPTTTVSLIGGSNGLVPMNTPILNTLDWKVHGSGEAWLEPSRSGVYEFSTVKEIKNSNTAVNEPHEGWVTVGFSETMNASEVSPFVPKLKGSFSQDVAKAKSWSVPVTGARDVVLSDSLKYIAVKAYNTGAHLFEMLTGNDFGIEIIGLLAELLMAGPMYDLYYDLDVMWCSLAVSRPTKELHNQLATHDKLYAMLVKEYYDKANHRYDNEGKYGAKVKAKYPVFRDIPAHKELQVRVSEFIKVNYPHYTSACKTRSETRSFRGIYTDTSDYKSDS